MRRVCVALVAGSLALAACQDQPSTDAPAAEAAVDTAGIEAAMADSVAGWNEGDVDRFLGLYSHDPRASFVGSEGLKRGLPAMEQAYRENYDFDDIGARGKLAIERLDLRSLGPDHALYIGRFHLTYDDPAKDEVTGLTSLVFAREAEGWKVIADHSS